jgi:hypothetical protein
MSNLDELVRDLCKAETRSKSNTRKVLEAYNFHEYSISEWARVGRMRGYFKYFNLPDVTKPL